MDDYVGGQGRLPSGLSGLLFTGFLLWLFDGEISSPVFCAKFLEVAKNKQGPAMFDDLGDNISALLDSVPDRIFIISSEGVILNIFGGADTNVIYTSKQSLGRAFSDLFPAPVAAEFQRVITKCLTSQQTQRLEYCFSPEQFSSLSEGVKPTTKQWFESRIHPLPEQYRGQDGVIWVVRNTTESEQMKSTLKRQAFLDELTGLMNRRSFFDAAKQLFTTRDNTLPECSLLMLDIDEFKEINDTYGHLAGDEVINQVARVLNSHIREGDILARLGGDEFAIILRDLDVKKAFSVAERMCASVRTFKLSQSPEPLQVTVSIGITDIHSTDSQIKPALNRADKALYHAKETGKNRVFCACR